MSHDPAPTAEEEIASALIHVADVLERIAESLETLVGRLDETRFSIDTK